MKGGAAGGPDPQGGSGDAVYGATTAFLWLAFILGGCGPALLPSDARLESNFRSNRADFEYVVRMAREDPRVHAITSDHVSIVDDSGEPVSGAVLPQERWNHYRSLFRKLRLEGLTRNSEYPGAVFLTAGAFGIVPAEVFKGYVYSNRPLSPLISTLDHGIPEQLADRWHPARYAFKDIGENWYLYYEND